MGFQRAPAAPLRCHVLSRSAGAPFAPARGQMTCSPLASGGVILPGIVRSSIHPSDAIATLGDVRMSRDRPGGGSPTSPAPVPATGVTRAPARPCVARSAEHIVEHHGRTAGGRRLTILPRLRRSPQRHDWPAKASRASFSAPSQARRWGAPRGDLSPHGAATPRAPLQRPPRRRHVHPARDDSTCRTLHGAQRTLLSWPYRAGLSAAHGRHTQGWGRAARGVAGSSPSP